MKTWKNHEQGVTEHLAKAVENKPDNKKECAWRDRRKWIPKRVSNLGVGTEIEDIVFGAMSIEDKTRANLPAYLHQFVKQAEKNSRGRIPIVIMHPNRSNLNDDYVIMRVETLIRLLEELVWEEEDETAEVD
jgi:hypothetical protein